MKHLAFILGILAGLLVPVVASAQSKTLKVSGTVKDAQDKGLAGVSILVRTADGTFGGVSGRNGEYEVNFTAADTVAVSYSYVGHQTYTFSTIAAEDIKRDVVLTDKSHTLGEVEVTASSINMKGDHVTYMPTKKQVNGANNGVLLLFNMMIPQLKVSPMENSVATSDQTSLGIFIDERQADANELARLRPKDIARVEYYDMPTGVFARSGIDRALNIVTKKYTSGGYVDVRTNTKVIYPQGNYSVQASFDKGNVNMLVMAGSNVSKTDYAGTSQNEYFKFDTPFVKYSYIDDNETKNLSDYGLLRATVRGKRSYFLAQAMLAWNETPDNTDIRSVSYSDNFYPAAKSFTSSYSNGLTPSLLLSHQIRFNKKDMLNWNLSYSYSRNKNRSRYEEGYFAPIINNVKDRYHSLMAGLNYLHAFGNGGQLNFELANFLNNSNSVYSGTSPSEQEMLTNEFLFISRYTHRFGKKFSLMLRFGIDVNTYKVNGMETVTKLYTRPGLNANYKIDGTSSLTLTAYAGSFTPSLSVMNEAEQRLSEYEVLRGNPYLKSGKPITSVLSYSKYWTKFSLSAYAMYDGIIDNPVSSYITEGNKMVKTYINGGNSHSYTLGINGVLRLLSNSLQLRVSPTFSHVALTGTYKNRHSQLGFYSELYYSTGAFSFSGYYSSPQTYLNSTPWYYKEKCNYGASASWNYRGLFVQVGCRNIFNGKRYHAGNYFDFGAYNIHGNTVSRALSANVYVNLSYSFDFGREVQRQNVNVDTSSKSGILK